MIISAAKGKKKEKEEDILLKTNKSILKSLNEFLEKFSTNKL
jgi:hypothetical protein